MILTLKEKAVIRDWNKSGLRGLRISSLMLLENVGGGDGDDVEVGVSGGVAGMLIRHTLRCMPQGLWDDAKVYCEEILFIAGLEFDEALFMDSMVSETSEREDEEFD